MSAALIRRCNKCSTSFIKEHGCNKVSKTTRELQSSGLAIADWLQMTCPTCSNLQCYVCSKSCTYTHFNDPARGGKKGNCPLFDEEGTEARHSKEVKKAESVARSRVLQENAELDAALLEFKTSKKVRADEERRKNQG